jgi:hypothetical protein
MILGPHALLGNNPRSIEYNVEWITDLIKYRGEKVVPRKGLEPPLSYEKRILSPPRLPFRHLGTSNTAAIQQTEIILESLNITRHNVKSFKAKK